MPTQVKGWRITLDKYRATWNWFTANPQGGGFGSNYCGPKKVALARAARNIPDGATFTVVTKHRGKIISVETMRK